MTRSLSLAIDTASLLPVDQLYAHSNEDDFRLSPVDELWILELHTGESRQVVWSPLREELDRYLDSHHVKSFNFIKLDRKNRVLDASTARERQQKQIGRCRDWLYRKAVDYVIRERSCSMRMLCVQLCVKEDTAAQLIGFMVEDRIVAKQIKDDHTRDVLLSEKEWEELRVAFNIAPSPEPNGRPSKWRDHLYDDAIKVVLHERRGSVSLLQRVFGIGYGRAARLIGFMAEDGIVGEAKERGGESRDVLLTEEQWNAKKSA